MQVYDDHLLGVPFVYHYIYTALNGKTRLMLVNHRHAWCLFEHDNEAIVEDYYERIETEKQQHDALSVLLHYYRIAKAKGIFYQKAY